MKKIVTVLSLLMSTALIGQTEMNKWSVGLNVGGHRALAPTAVSLNNPINLNHYAINGRYMMNNRFGLMLDLGYDRMVFKPEDLAHTNYVRYSLQGVVNVTDLLHFNDWTQRLGLLVHGGAGVSHMWNQDRTRANSDDILVDNMLNYTFGITPQVKLTERVSLNADMSFIFHARQNLTYDMTRKNPKGPIDGYLLNLSVGATFALGKKDRHADWTYSDKKDDGMLKALEDKVRKMDEGMQDDDNDGIPNYLDEEPNTPKGAMVDSKGRTIPDADGDGVPDHLDACPDVPGILNGCPDTDGDGIPDHLDECPETPGTFKNQGCPSVPDNVQSVLDKSFSDIQFELGQAKLKSSSNAYLDQLVTILNENPEYSIKVSGHACSLGTPELNMDLSKRRAETVKTYITGKGIAANRVKTAAFGETQPVADNNTPEGKERNRRVELLILQ